MADHAIYNRQISTESGWDNPFRPDGDLSREADEIVSLIKGGKPITPTPAALPELAPDDIKEEYVCVAHTNNVSASPAAAPPTNALSSPLRSPRKAMNGSENGAVAERPGPVEVQRSQPQQPQQPEHVTIKKKPKCKCCVIQ